MAALGFFGFCFYVFCVLQPHPGFGNAPASICPRRIWCSQSSWAVSSGRIIDVCRIGSPSIWWAELLAGDLRPRKLLAGRKLHGAYAELDSRDAAIPRGRGGYCDAYVVSPRPVRAWVGHRRRGAVVSLQGRMVNERLVLERSTYANSNTLAIRTGDGNPDGLAAGSQLARGPVSQSVCGRGVAFDVAALFRTGSREGLIGWRFFTRSLFCAARCLGSLDSSSP